MKYKERLISQRLLRLTEHFPVVVISGARQVGKSTLLNHLFPPWDAVVFDPVVDAGNARTDPDLFLKNHPEPLILDEIQYCPETIFEMDQHAWPSDGKDRTILALTMHAQATKREPAFLDEILDRLSQRINEQGYIGPVYPDGVTHEQAMRRTQALPPGGRNGAL